MPVETINTGTAEFDSGTGAYPEKPTHRAGADLEEERVARKRVKTKSVEDKTVSTATTKKKAAKKK